MNYIIVSMSLSKEKIILNLSPACCLKLGELSILEEIDSTNRWLMDRARTTDVHNDVCLALRQTAGVGRSGKPWFSRHTDNILMSVAHRFDMPLAQLSSLSLVVGIAIVNALESFGVRQLSLKWPNDVYLAGRKLAGILIQTQTGNDGKHCAIIGIGINIRIDEADKKAIEQPVAQLSEHGYGVDQREKIIALIITDLLSAFEQFSKSGLDTYLERWGELDHLKQQAVILTRGEDRVSGNYLGINSQGAIRLALPNNRINEYYVGELSLRAIT